MGDLAADTEITGGDGRYRGAMSKEWEIWGPMGGYVASFAMRAAGAELSLSDVTAPNWPPWLKNPGRFPVRSSRKPAILGMPTRLRTWSQRRPVISIGSIHW